jgi:hypothetical protein
VHSFFLGDNGIQSHERIEFEIARKTENRASFDTLSFVSCAYSRDEIASDENGLSEAFLDLVPSANHSYKMRRHSMTRLVAERCSTILFQQCRNQNWLVTSKLSICRNLFVEEDSGIGTKGQHRNQDPMSERRSRIGTEAGSLLPF